MTVAVRFPAALALMALAVHAACAAAPKATPKPSQEHQFGVIGHSFSNGGGEPQLEQSLAKNVVYSLSARAITDVFVEGEAVVRDRALVRVALAEVQERVRALTADWRRD